MEGLVISLLNELLKVCINKSINNGNKLLDVTASFKQHTFEGCNILIKSDNIDINVGYGDKFLFKIYLKDIKEAEYISIDYETESMIITSSKKNIQGKIEITLPELSKIEIYTLNADICILPIKVRVMKVMSDNGDINVEIKDILEGKVVSKKGDIVLRLPENVYKLKLKTDTGDIVKEVKNVSSSLKTIKCKSEYGDISILKS